MDLKSARQDSHDVLASDEIPRLPKNPLANTEIDLKKE
jgi:hypothetical protein